MPRMMPVGEVSDQLYILPVGSVLTGEPSAVTSSIMARPVAAAGETQHAMAIMADTASSIDRIVLDAQGSATPTLRKSHYTAALGAAACLKGPP